MAVTSQLLVLAALLAAAVPVLGFNATDCSEVPGCLNEYEWKHKVQPPVATAFCKDRYPTCKNIDAKDMPEYCKKVLPLCRLFVYGYLDMTTKGSEEANAFCKKRMPRCYAKK